MNKTGKIKNAIKAIFNVPIYILAILFPLASSVVILANYGRLYLESNNYSFLRYLKDRQRKGKKIPYRVFMITSNQNEKGNLNPKKLRDLFLILRCKTFFVTHGSGDLFWTKIGRDPRRLFIMLYHGTTVKEDGIISNYKEWKYKMKIDSSKHLSKDKKLVFKPPKLIHEDFYRLYWIVPSKLERFFISASVKFPIEQCIPIGHLRDDLLFSQSPSNNHWEGLVQDYIKGFEKIILYAPTFRSIYEKIPPYLPFLEDFSLSSLERLLERHSAVLFYRLHINIRKMAEEFTSKFSSPFIKDASFKVLPYVAYLLKYTDILITDYSGIIYDFIPLNRPMIALSNDWKLYNRVRGFRLHYDRIFPGIIVENFTQLQKVIEQYLKNPQKDSEKRKYWLNIIRDFTDDKNSTRMYSLLQRLLIVNKK